ncbi:hypothetical protein [Actinopolyspora mortivallis]|uniref:hypothetical protein n=1 Tax=Actinopolyspora mortivallis TaxID=33906 RepID=UPI00037A9CFD|nr:hypothetical protein [Actinopolyspora mortivallis]
MRAKVATLAVLAFATVVAVSSCTGSESPDDTAGSSHRTRAPHDPILGVANPRDGNLPECVDTVVHREKNVPTAEFTVTGQPGDVFSYEILKKDGSTVTGTSGTFGSDQRKMIFTTGVPNAEIKTVTISARGRVGTPGKCVITTIE